MEGNDGYKNYVAFMDKHFKKESISDMCEAIRSFMKLSKSEDQTMSDYLSTFDSMYNRACTKGLTDLPQPYLMFLVLENAHLDVQDYRLVLTSIDFKKVDDLYDQARESLIKYFGALKPQTNQPQMKLEDCTNHETFKRKSSSTKS